ncbi:uncharacterized protein LOC110990801 [Acanthaster planci]|uniref:Uncharacterized protein LOC110990801 n=1 Tax=Acanthaster planci TaxID=133434 RepID=A0A8B8A1N6_ACAPL|nr:uncharacterized protein LOC110990801 [Acanthaster planci]
MHIHAIKPSIHEVPELYTNCNFQERDTDQWKMESSCQKKRANGYDSEDSDDDNVALAGIQKRMQSANQDKVKDVFHGMSHQDQTLELILDLLGDIQSKLAAVEKRQERMEQKQDRLRELVKLVLVRERREKAADPHSPTEDTPRGDRQQPLFENRPRVLFDSPAVSTGDAYPTPVPVRSMAATETPQDDGRDPNESEKSVSSPATLMPRTVTGPENDTYLLGGNEGMVRAVDDYKVILKEVQQRKRCTDNDRGRLMCINLLKREIPKKELAAQNVTGNSRDENNKRCKIPQINRSIVHSIFSQAKMQFPGFTDWYTDSRCKTVEALNECCKRARYEVIIRKT